MDNQNGYNYNGVVPNSQVANTQVPQYGTGQSVQPVMQQPVTTVSAQPSYQVPTQNLQVAQSAVSNQPSYSQSQAQQVMAPSGQVTYSQVSQPSSQPQVSYPQSAIKAVPVAPQNQSYPQTTQVITQQPVGYAQQTSVQQSAQQSYAQSSNGQTQLQVSQIPQQVSNFAPQNMQTQVVTPQPVQPTQSQPIAVSPVANSNTLPVNPIIDLNPQTQVMPIEQTINQEQVMPPKPPEDPQIPSIFVPDPALDAEIEANNPTPSKKKISLPKLSKKQLIIIGAVAVALVLVVILTTVLGSNNSAGGSSEPSNDIISNSNSDGKEDDSYKDLPIDNWLSYKFEVNGKQSALPISYEQLSSITGFAMKTNYKEQTLEKNNNMSVNLYKKSKLSLYTEIYNPTSGDIKLSKGNVTRISQTYEQVKKGADVVLFPANLKVGMEMTRDNLIKLLGTPSTVKNYSSNDYVNNSYIYYAGERTSVNYYEIKIVNDVIDQITIDHRG